MDASCHNPLKGLPKIIPAKKVTHFITDKEFGAHTVGFALRIDPSARPKTLGGTIFNAGVCCLPCCGSISRDLMRDHVETICSHLKDRFDQPAQLDETFRICPTWKVIDCGDKEAENGATVVGSKKRTRKPAPKKKKDLDSYANHVATRFENLIGQESGFGSIDWSSIQARFTSRDARLSELWRTQKAGGLCWQLVMLDGSTTKEVMERIVVKVLKKVHPNSNLSVVDPYLAVASMFGLDLSDFLARLDMHPLLDALRLQNSNPPVSQACQERGDKPNGPRVNEATSSVLYAVTSEEAFRSEPVAHYGSLLESPIAGDAQGTSSSLYGHFQQHLPTSGPYNTAVFTDNSGIPPGCPGSTQDRFDQWDEKFGYEHGVERFPGQRNTADHSFGWDEPFDFDFIDSTRR
ncbi:hypothetical protein BDZ85DRAFT_317499 [Elsinoe ampelina]|uniref:Uncharacterized protein n=1 Tax=Elsinoe ampelina TaxID=302913 RepID=A0A6A6GGY7_9PEZI|nr:hypothetical protein BDZ85DRAFT_317499 [Elsinoe ampelina]